MPALKQNNFDSTVYSSDGNPIKTNETPFKPKSLTLLVANRGEIAVRVLRAGREAGFKTIGIYAENDRCGGHLDC